jgi:hypothetical protein
MEYSLTDYTAAVRQFLTDSHEWADIDRYQFYTSDSDTWRETCDNAHGGLDVSWAFYAVRERHREGFNLHTGRELTDTEIATEFDRLVAEYMEEIGEE